MSERKADRAPGTSFTAVKTGRSVEVTVRRVGGHWQASKVQPRAGAGRAEPGDDNAGGNDDGANHR